MGERHTAWPTAVVEAVSDVLGATDTGLTGTEIGQLLSASNVPDLYPTESKRHRLREALLARQFKDSASNCIIRFICEAMSPVRYTAKPGLFSTRQDALNEVLVHVGLRVNDQGRIARGASASTLSEAAKHASALRTELRRRGTHQQVLDYCTEEILQKNAFHASLEAAKSVADRLRKMTGQHLDGGRLVDAVLTAGQSGTPNVAINSHSTPSEVDEQKGFANIVRGLFSMFRNPVAHDPRINRTVTDDDLLEVLTTVSMIHRRLDTATVTP
jgi:uncharacterized protein (TIGR02391 family)